MSSTEQGNTVLAADGRPLKVSLNRALRAQKLRALMLIAPLLTFILITFVAPIADMLFRSVENQIVEQTLPRTVIALDQHWDDEDTTPPEIVFAAMAYDLHEAVERRAHTRVGSRLNYETTGISSLFRKSGRGIRNIGKEYQEQFVNLDSAWGLPETLLTVIAHPEWAAQALLWEGTDLTNIRLADGIVDVLPETASAYRSFANSVISVDGNNPAEVMPWNTVYLALFRDLESNADATENYTGSMAGLLADATVALPSFERISLVEQFESIDEDWLTVNVWATIGAFSSPYTAGYYLASIDLQYSADGIQAIPEDQRIYIKLFQRTIFMSVVITFMCILLGYPIAYLLSNLPVRTSNLLLILVLLPFWTSLLVRTSAWKVILQQQGVINDTLVWIGLVSDGERLALINNQFGTIVAMTHILLPFMILPLFSVMKTIPPSLVRAAKSLGANDWTAFWRIYFPQSIPGIGAGCVLVFILAIGYYITPELVGGSNGTFISNRIAYHISRSLNWGLAAALGTILLVLVLVLYWLYDRIVGIDNVKLG